MKDETELPSGWAGTTLGQVVDILDSRRIPVNSDEREKRLGKVPYFGATGQVGWIDDFLFDEQLVLLGEDGAPFLDSAKTKAYLIEGKSWVNNHAHVLRGRQGISNKFLLHQLNQIEYRPFVSGSTRLKLPQGPMRTIPLVLAPEPEQNRIVAEIDKHFTRLDAGVEALKRVQANLKRYRASVLKAACEGRLVPTEAELARAEGRGYETGEQLLGRVEKARLAAPSSRSRTGKQKEYPRPDLESLPPLPPGWCWATLAQVAELKGGITKGQKRVEGDQLREVPYLRVANVQRGYLDLAEVKTIEATEEEIAQLLLSPGDVLFNEGGDRDKLGRGWVWRGEIPGCIHQNHVFRGRLYLDAIESKYISWYGNSFGQQYFQEEGKQTTNLASINLTKLSALPVPIPPSMEQQRIVAEVERLLSIVESLEQAIQMGLTRSVRMRQSILAAAFEGNLVPQDKSDEPAAALLKRIQQARAQASSSDRAPRHRSSKLPLEA